MYIAARMPRPGALLLAALLGAHVAISVASLNPGYLSVDEGTYHIMVKSLADHGSLAFSNGYEEFPSLELMTGSVRLHEGRLVPVTPILYAIVSFPFYRAAGYAGLQPLTGSVRPYTALPWSGRVHGPLVAAGASLRSK